MGVPVVSFLVPLCLVIALRSTRGWWLPGAATFAVGLAMFLIIAATHTSSGHGGDIPIIDGAALIGFLGFLLMIHGGICLGLGAVTSRSGRQARRAGAEIAVSGAYVVNRYRT